MFDWWAPFCESELNEFEYVEQLYLHHFKYHCTLETLEGPYSGAGPEIFKLQPADPPNPSSTSTRPSSTSIILNIAAALYLPTAWLEKLVSVFRTLNQGLLKGSPNSR